MPNQQGVSPQDVAAQQAQQVALNNAQAHTNPYTAPVEANANRLAQQVAAPQQMPQVPTGGAMSGNTANMLARGTGSPFDAVNELVVGQQQRNAENASHDFQMQQYQAQQNEHNAAMLEQTQQKAAVMQHMRNWVAAHPKEAIAHGFVNSNGELTIDTASAKQFLSAWNMSKGAEANRIDEMKQAARLQRQSHLADKKELLQDQYKLHDAVVTTQFGKLLNLGKVGERNIKRVSNDIAAYNSMFNMVIENQTPIKTPNGIFTVNENGTLQQIQNPSPELIGKAQTIDMIKRGVASKTYSISADNYDSVKIAGASMIHAMNSNSALFKKIKGLDNAAWEEYAKSVADNPKLKVGPDMKKAFDRNLYAIRAADVDGKMTPQQQADLAWKQSNITYVKNGETTRMPLAKGTFLSGTGDTLNINTKDGADYIKNWYQREAGLSPEEMVKASDYVNTIRQMPDWMQRETLKAFSMRNTASGMDMAPAAISNYLSNAGTLARNLIGKIFSSAGHAAGDSIDKIAIAGDLAQQTTDSARAFYRTHGSVPMNQFAPQ